LCSTWTQKDIFKKKDNLNLLVRIKFLD
jgi:hypothetical protein